MYSHTLLKKIKYGICNITKILPVKMVTINHTTIFLPVFIVYKMCAGPLNERPSPEGKGDSITARCSKVCRCALDLVLPWLGYSSESIPSPGTSICHRCGHKNITKQKEVMLCFKDRVQ